MPEETSHHIEEAQVRRAPRFSVFLGIGAIVGLIVAFVLTYAFELRESATEITYSRGQILGFFALYCVPIGLGLGGLVAVIFDNVLRRRARTVRIDRESVRDIQPEPNASVTSAAAGGSDVPLNPPAPPRSDGASPS